MKSIISNPRTIKQGYYISVALALSTFITFAFAMIAVPPCGPYCTGDCIEYPYLDTLRQYPRDYIWLYLALAQSIIFLIYASYQYLTCNQNKKIFSYPGANLAVISTGILLLTYYVNAIVIPQSLSMGQTEGIALLTMYNENGVFIAQEEIAYILMAISLFFISLAMDARTVKEKWLRLILKLPLIVSIIAYVYFSIKYGFERSYRFEVAAITINWLTLITAGILHAVILKSQLKKQ